MKGFLIALQFLTRIRLVRQTEWTNEDFGKSVAWFPAIGWIIAAFLYMLFYLTKDVGSTLLTATVLVVGELLVTGAILSDGLMDAADGLFSGRTRERALEIMKDSTVGAFGLMAFVLLTLLKIAAMSAVGDSLPVLIATMPVVGRLALTISVCRYPYARPYGIGHSFAAYAPNHALFVAALCALLPALWFGFVYCLLLGAGVTAAVFLNEWVVKKIGGVTGDTYGFVTELTEGALALLFVFLVRGFT